MPASTGNLGALASNEDFRGFRAPRSTHPAPNVEPERHAEVRRPTRRRWLVIRRASFIPAAVLLVVVAGCGADGSPSASPSVSSEPSVSAAPLATATLAPATAAPTPSATASAA